MTFALYSIDQKVFEKNTLALHLSPDTAAVFFAEIFRAAKRAAIFENFAEFIARFPVAAKLMPSAAGSNVNKNKTQK